MPEVTRTTQERSTRETKEIIKQKLHQTIDCFIDCYDPTLTNQQGREAMRDVINEVFAEIFEYDAEKIKTYGHLVILLGNAMSRSALFRP